MDEAPEYPVEELKQAISDCGSGSVVNQIVDINDSQRKGHTQCPLWMPATQHPEGQNIQKVRLKPRFVIPSLLLRYSFPVVSFSAL